MDVPLGILGLGYLGQKLVWQCEVVPGSWGTYQNASIEELPASIKPIWFDWQVDHSWENIPTHCAKIILTIPPVHQALQIESELLHRFGKWMNQYRTDLTDLVYISTTGVYPNQAGMWLEQSNSFPETEKGKLRVQSERILSEYFNCRVIRAGAIYGPGRHVGKRILNRKPIPKGEQPIHRIHVNDLAQICRLALFSETFPEVVNAIDEEATTTQKVAQWLMEQPKFLRNKPPNILYKDGNVTRKNLPENRNRRISNERLKSISGFNYQYPTFREGMTQVIESDYQSV